MHSKKPLLTPQDRQRAPPKCSHRHCDCLRSCLSPRWDCVLLVGRDSVFYIPDSLVPSSVPVIGIGREARREAEGERERVGGKGIRPSKLVKW